MPGQKSKAKVMQEASDQLATQERMITVTARKSTGFEYHLSLPESVVKGIIDGDTPDVRIRIPVPHALSASVKYRYVLSSIFEEIDIHDELTPDVEEIKIDG